jgi:hypothetical protein
MDKVQKTIGSQGIFGFYLYTKFEIYSYNVSADTITILKEKKCFALQSCRYFTIYKNIPQQKSYGFRRSIATGNCAFHN